MTSKTLVLLDIDGVLADDSHRVKHALVYNWNEYFRPETVAADLMLPDGGRLYDMAVNSGSDVAYLTGRREDLRPTTTAWLKSHGMHTEGLLMRPITEHARLADYKAGVVQHLKGCGYDQIILYDDDVRVVDRVNGLKDPSLRAHHCQWYIKQRRMVNRGYI